MEANFHDTFSKYWEGQGELPNSKSPQVWTSIHLYGFFPKQAQLLMPVEVHNPVF